MNPSEQDFDEIDRLMSLALQKSGDLFPLDLPEDEFLTKSSSSESKESVARIVAAVLRPDEPDLKIVDFPQVSQDLDLSEYARAARNGQKLSDETLEKLAELREENRKE